LLLFLAMLGLTVPATAQGSWTGPYDWSSCLAVPGCTTLSEISHAALIPTGPYRGKVLMWREPTSATCNPLNTGEGWIFDPITPHTLIRIDQVLDSNIFCAGASWDPEGELVICGGDRNTSILRAAYRFRPLILTTQTIQGACGPEIPVRPSNPAWYTLDDTLNGHYYPGLLALTKKTLNFNSTCSGTCSSITGGAHLLLGGPVYVSYYGQNVMEFLPYLGSQWRSVSHPLHYVPLSDAANADDRYVRMSVGNDPSPSARLDSYPRAIQLSTDDILIAFDLDTADPCATWVPPPLPASQVCPNTQPNEAAEWWVLRPYGGYGQNADRFELWRGSSAGGQPNFDRNYAPAVLMHQTVPGPEKHLDRVLVFGGADFTATTATVQEFVKGTPVGNEGTVVSGSWIGKVPLNLARNFSVGLPLPDGRILVTQGCSNPSPYTANAIVQPELYDPGRLPGDSGSSTLMAASNTVGTTNQSTSRTYHHVAVLLPDGRVFIAGGEVASAGFANGQYTGEIFEPPYLNPDLSKAFIQSTDTVVNLNAVSSTTQTFRVVVNDVSPDMPIGRVVLTRPASVTHGFDTDQRYIELPYTTVSSVGNRVELSVTSPQENLAPPGYYMLWVVVIDPTDPDIRIPTSAEFVKFR